MKLQELLEMRGEIVRHCAKAEDLKLIIDVSPLFDEIDRLRRIEDAARMNAKCLSYGAKKPNMTQVLRDNPRPEE